MAVKCDICGKKPGFGHNVSHSHKKTKRRWLPNIQKKKLTIEGKKTKTKICAQCLKTQSKIKEKS